MAKISRQKLKDYFFPTSKPLVVQFYDWIDSFVHKDDTIPYDQVDGLGEALDANKEEVRDLIADATSNNKGIFTTLAKLKAAYPSIENKKGWYAFVDYTNPREKYIVTADRGEWTATGELHNVMEVNLDDYAKNGSSKKTLQKVDDDKADKSSFILENLLNNDLAGFMLDTRIIEDGVFVSNVGHKHIVTCKAIRVKAGDSISVSGAFYKYPQGIRGVISSDIEGKDNRELIVWTQIDNGYYFTSIIDGYFFVDFELNPEKTALKKNSQIQTGNKITDYLPFGETKIKGNTLPNGLDKVIVYISKNLINPTLIDYTKRYSPGSKSIVAATGTSFALYTIHLDEGLYILSPEMPNMSSGGFFAKESDTVAINSILFYTPVTGNGAVFDVPKGGVWVRFNIRLTAAGSGTPAHNYQLENGEVPTEYEPYNPVEQLNPSLLPKQEKPKDSSLLDKYMTFDLNTSLNGLLPKFVQVCIMKNMDVPIWMGVTSILSRTIEHCTEHVNAKFRPPLMHANNAASHIWDALHKLWGNVQQYRRYDSSFFTETGNWKTTHSMDEWDDSAGRNGLTRYSTDSNASISCIAPKGAWQFSPIFRTDTLASETIRVDIAEGNGLAQVWDEATDSWVELNGYIFSQQETPITILPSITFKHPSTGVETTIENYQTKGNTTYQKRLKFRFKGEDFDSRDVEKRITFTNIGTGKMTYWGVEWSTREFMITLINGARGGHSSAIGSAVTSLTHYIDNDLKTFKPMLILSEDGVHNAGGSGVPLASYNSWSYGNIVENFFLGDNPVSIKQRCIDLGVDVPEFMLFNSTIAVGFNGIDEDGNLIAGLTKDGLMWTALDSQMSSWRYISEKYPEVMYINATKHWCDCCSDAFGDMRSATKGSGKDGKTLTAELSGGSHPNDTGSRVLARPIVAALNMY